ncbi:hypothetical protein INR49_006093, partial [Caranx melampygus]
KLLKVQLTGNPWNQQLHKGMVIRKIPRPLHAALQGKELERERGKWVVTPNYVLDSVKNGSWLAEGPYEVAISTGTSSAFCPARQWREKVVSGRLTGAFQGWKVLLVVQEPTRRAMFIRLLNAGTAKVYNSPPPAQASITHVMMKPFTENSKPYSAPCYSVSHIVQHLFGNHCVDMNFMMTHENPAESKKASFTDDLSNLETELKDYVTKQEATETDFSNVGSMIECGLFTEALDSIRSAVFPGLLPPVPYLHSLLEYAQQGNATPVFLRNFQQVLCNLLTTNPPWWAPSTVKKYFTQLLQCPRCKTGPWPFLETAIRDFALLQGSGVSQVSASGSLLYGTFWTVWERSTLLSRAVKQLTQFVVQAATEKNEKNEKQELHLADTLTDILSVLVEFWCQQHFKLNQSLVEKGLKDLAEHFAVVSQDVSPVILTELVVRVSSTRLKLVLSYLPALGNLAQSPSGVYHRTGPSSRSCTSQETGCRTQSSLANDIPRGMNRVNMAERPCAGVKEGWRVKEREWGREG